MHSVSDGAGATTLALSHGVTLVRRGLTSQPSFIGTRIAFRANTGALTPGPCPGAHRVLARNRLRAAAAPRGSPETQPVLLAPRGSPTVTAGKLLVLSTASWLLLPLV